jgi:hypothetical protein
MLALFLRLTSSRLTLPLSFPATCVCTVQGCASLGTTTSFYRLYLNPETLQSRSVIPICHDSTSLSSNGAMGGEG